MKIRILLSFLLASFFLPYIHADEKNEANQIVIGGTKFTFPLINKWISEYSKINPKVKITLNTKANAQNVDLSVIAHQPTQNESAYTFLNVGVYALIPVTNNYNPQLSSFPKRGLSKKDIDNLFFEVIDYERDEPEKKSKYPAIIYTRDNKACTSAALAKHFGRNTSDIRGKRVFGDDAFLNYAIKKDSIAITYNTLNNVFDTETRKLKDGLAVLPINIRNEQKEAFSTNLDAVIHILESFKIDQIPVEKFGFIVNTDNNSNEITAFLNWVLTDGQKFNKDLGFLALDNTQIAEEKRKIETKLLTQN